MGLKIDESSLLERKSLEVGARGVTLVKTAGFGGRKTHPFDEIVCVLMSPDSKLSVQAGQEVFSIQTNPAKPKHSEAINALVRELRASATRA
jgi:hypothetical protein